MTKLAPCPFCEGADIRFDRHIDHRSPTGEVWSMCCYQCGATFPNRYRKELLVEKWNTRANDPTRDDTSSDLEPIKARGMKRNPYSWKENAMWFVLGGCFIAIAFALAGCGESVSERSANQKRDYKIDDADRSTEHRLRSLEERVTALEKRP